MIVGIRRRGARRRRSEARGDRASRPSRWGRARAFLERHGRTVLIVFVTSVLFEVAWPTLHLTHRVPGALQPVIAALAALPFLLVGIRPMIGWCVSAGAAVVIPLAFDPAPHAPGGPPWQAVHIIVLLSLFVVVCLTQAPVRVAIAWAGTVAVFAIFAPGSDGFGWAVGLTAILVFTVLLRRLWLSRRQLARQEELGRVERSRRAVLEERARIARDLHDVVAHHMSLVVVQSQTARYRVAGLPAQAYGEFDSIAATAREALDEVRAMLGVLRSEEDAADRAPQPGVDRIAELVDASGRAGIDVRLAVAGDLDRIGTAAGVVLYRIVQESISNATRHAPGAPVQVRVSVQDGDAQAVIVNGPATGRVPPADGSAGGNGLPGMRERAAAVGGALEAGMREDGGFAVRCRVPVRARAAGDGVAFERTTGRMPG